MTHLSLDLYDIQGDILEGLPKNHACPVDTQEHQIWWRFVGSLASSLDARRVFGAAFWMLP